MLKKTNQYDNNNFFVVFMARKSKRLKEHFAHEPSCFTMFSFIRNCAVSIFSLFMDLFIQCCWIVYRFGRNALNTTLCHKVCQWIGAGRWFSPGTPVSSTSKTDRHDMSEILLKMALNTITPLVIYLHCDLLYANTTSLYYPFIVTTFRVDSHWSYGSWIYNYVYNQCISPH